MICKETQTFMDGYLDGELDLVRAIELERHLHECAECARLHKDRQVVREAMGAISLRYRAPEALRRNVHAALAASAGETKQKRWVWPSWPTLAATAAAAALVLIWWVRPPERPLERDAVSSHIRSLMANHLTDVPSSDQHTVKPWFAGKLDFSPPVKDLPDVKLIGGRLDYLENQAVAALVYQKRQHVINVFVWPSPDHPAKASVLHGYNVVDLTNGGMRYVLVSDLNRAEMEQLGARLAVP
jgi:anti-sigma factor RsiW